MHRDALTSRLLALILGGFLGLPSSAVPVFVASDAWSGVIGLEKYTEVRLELRAGQLRNGGSWLPIRTR